MRTIGEKVSYLQGLAEGLNLKDSLGAASQLIEGMLEVLGELSDDLEYLTLEVEDYKEYVESIDEDLDDLESEVYDFDDDDFDFDDEDDEDEEEYVSRLRSEEDL